VFGAGGEIKSGLLVSTKSKNIYKIVDYVPIMLTDMDQAGYERYKGWAYQWRSKHFEYNTTRDDFGVDVSNIIDEYHLNKISLQNKVVFEAGCGGGRLTRLLYRRGVKEYFCVDISESIFEARAKHKELKNSHFIMADIAHPPFRNESIDIIFNIAVLQHTEDPQQTLYGMAAALKRFGIILTGHYMVPKNLLIRFKVFYCELIRTFIRVFRIPKRLVLAFTYLSVPANRYALLRPLAWAFFQNPPGKMSEKVIWQNNFDFYNPATFQHWKTEQQTQTMLLKAGLVPILETSVFPNAYVCEKRI
jgi:SAM-dependent methyltransferase